MCLQTFSIYTDASAVRSSAWDNDFIKQQPDLIHISSEAFSPAAGFILALPSNSPILQPMLTVQRQQRMQMQCWL